MQYVITLTANPNLTPLTGQHVILADMSLMSLGAHICSKRWLSMGSAIDIVFEQISMETARKVVSIALKNFPIDVNIQEIDNRRKKILVADMDSTIIVNESLDELADFIGLKTKVETITQKAMHGEIDFEIALKQRVKLFEGQSETLIDRFLVEKINITSGAECLIKTMKANKAKTALISGGFSYITKYIAERLGFDIHYGNQLIIKDRKLTGKVSTPILNADSKKEILINLAKNNNIQLNQTMAVGDGANDIKMLRCAGTGIAFRAKPIVKASTPYHVKHGDLRSLLFLQGYHEDEFVE
ncbi:MAG: phosphoserine phosphatase SerB [Alphaproteobacteria bacterium]|nr:phosphoserine phosphatase SerB [Alphaproteobacteria bacterium]